MKLAVGFSVFLLLLVFAVSACASLEPQASLSELATWDELEGLDNVLSAAAITTYYVSGTGSDSNNGTSSTTPFRTLQKAANLTNPGDTVYIMNGTYTDPGVFVLYISRSGEPGKYIRYKAFPGHKPVLQSTSTWSSVRVDGAAYILIEGLTLIGNNDNVTEAQARTQLKDTNGDGKPDSFDPDPKYAGGGIDITYKLYNFAQPAHHVIVRNNTLSKFGGSSIGSYGADFLVIEDNRVDSSGFYSPFGTSGISFYQNRDTQPGYAGYRIVVRRNVSKYNRNLLPCFCSGFATRTDGNGIIIDDSKNSQSDGRPPENGVPQDFGPYTGKMLIANNIFYENWGRGIHVFESDNVNIINNTTFSNSYDPDIPQGEISVLNSDTVRVYNNIVAPYQYRSGITNKSYRQGQLNNSNVVIDYNLAFGGNGFFDPNPDISDPIATRNNLIGVDPKFLTVADRNFKLQTNSPAIDKGYNFGFKDDLEKSLRPKGVGVDIGAYEIR
jgi:parallel beta-helix repeat protein